MPGSKANNPYSGMLWVYGECMKQATKKAVQWYELLLKKGSYLLIIF
jgi:hypothetical protein